MIQTTHDPRAASNRESFSAARSRLAEARRLQRQKDTPAHRASVAARLAEIDAVLDAHLATRRRERGPDDGTGSSIGSTTGAGVDRAR